MNTPVLLVIVGINDLEICVFFDEGSQFSMLEHVIVSLIDH